MALPTESSPTSATPSRSVAGAKEAAQVALLDAITQGVADVRGNEAHSVAGQSDRLRSLALSYRFVAGGQQPGGLGVAE